MSNIAESVGKRLRGFRLEKGMSQEKLAHKAGLHPTYIGQVERGEKNLTIQSLERITMALEVPISSMFEKMEERDVANNYCLKAYELLVNRTPEDRKRLYSIMEEIDALSRKG